MSLGTLTVDLVMKTGKFESDTKRAEKRAKQMAKEIDASISKVGAALGTAAVAGFAAFAVGIKSAVDAADEMGKVAQKIGVSTEALSGLSFAASQSEVDLGQLQKALAKIAVDIAAGGGEFEKLGITATTADQALLQLADKFAAMPDGINKTAAAAKIFGERIGPDLIPLLNLGRAGIEDLTGRARELGGVISDEMARNADKFNDTMDEMKFAMQGAFLKVADDLLPEMQKFADYMASAEFSNRILTGLSAVGKIALAIAEVTALIVELTEYAGKRVGEAVAGSAGANGDIKYIEGRLKDLRELQANPVLNAFSAYEGGYEQKIKEFEALRAEALAAQQRQKAAAVFGSISDTSNPAGRKTGGPTLDAVLVDDKEKKKSSALTDAQREAKALQQSYESLNNSLAEQITLFGLDSEAAKVRYETEFGGLAKLDIAKKQELITQAEKIDALRKEQELQKEGKALIESLLTVDEKINIARADAKRLYDENIISINDYNKALESLKTPAEEELERLRNELELLGLTNEERAKRAFLLNNPGASEADAEQAAGLVRAIEQAARAQQAMDAFRSSAADAFEGFLTGSMSAADAFESFADSVVSQIARILAQQAIESLFGGFGGAGGGSFGGGIASFFGSLFGGGRANGGAVSPGRYYRVNENGPEMLTYQGKDFLMMGQGAGMVHSNSGGSNITVNVSPTTDRRTAQQVAQRIAEKGNMAMARNK